MMLAGSNTPENLRKNLATCLSNQAIALVNAGIEEVKESTKAYDQIVEQFMDRIRKNRTSNNCAACGASRYPGRTFYKVNLDFGQVTLCEVCLGALQTIPQVRPKPPKSAIEKIEDACVLLTEASKLDPGSSHINARLREVKEILGKFSVPIPTRTTTTSRKNVQDIKKAKKPLFAWARKGGKAKSGIWGILKDLLLYIVLPLLLYGLLSPVFKHIYHWLFK